MRTRPICGRLELLGLIEDYRQGMVPLIVPLTLLNVAADSVNALGTTRYVATTGTDAGGCTDPNNPCASVQYAVDEADEGDVVKVAAGTYHGVNDYGGKSQMVYIDKTITVRGGYAFPGFESADPGANPTTLDAGEQGRVLYVVGEISPTLEGLVMTGGKVGARSLAAGYGAGLYIISATVTVSGCAIQNNEAVPWYEHGDPPYSFPTQGGAGGGLYIHAGDLSILHSRVEANRAWEGAGLYVHGGTASAVDNLVQGNTAYEDNAVGASGSGAGLYLDGAQTSLAGNTVSGYHAWGYGGGIYIVVSNATLDGNTVAGNTGVGSVGGKGWGMGGGLYIESSQVTLTGNTVSGNHSFTRGGGLYLTGAEAVLVGNSVSENSVQGGWYSPYGGGSGLYLTATHATLNKNILQSNWSEYAACGALCLSHSDLHAANTIVTDNLNGRLGGAIHLDGSVATLLHTTLARNSGLEGSGFHVAAGSTITLANTILVSHTVGIYVSGGSTATLEATLWGAGIWANETDWDGDGSITTGTINIHDDPAFVDPDIRDYHIAADSAAVDEAVDAGIIVDIDGHLRPYGSGFDIGADEYWPPCVLNSCIYLPLMLRNGP
ncbi:right-handed parallel beta-helix repeat-containing protein [Chloroflexota bacterium]